MMTRVEKKLSTSAFSIQTSTANMIKETETLHYVPVSFLIYL